MGETKIYRQKNLTFIVSPQRITVRTSLGQMFYLDPIAHYWRRKERTIALMIEIGEVRSLNELASWCGVGVAWVSTNHKYNTSNQDELVLQ